MLLPDPLGPRTASDACAGTSKRDVVEHDTRRLSIEKLFETPSTLIATSDWSSRARRSQTGSIGKAWNGGARRDVAPSARLSFSHPDCDRRLPSRGSTAAALRGVGSWAEPARTLASHGQLDHRSGITPNPETEALYVICQLSIPVSW